MVGFMSKAMNLFGLNKDKGAETGTEVQAGNLEQFLSELPSKIGYDVSFKRKETSEPGIHFNIEGSELESFLGENCEMLDALAHVSMRVLRRTEGVSNTPVEEGQENIFRVTFDAAGFRDKKATELKEIAATQRQRVIETGGKPSYIKALGPADRKIIHTHLADLGEVTSESIGRGNFKRIRVKLKDDSQFKVARAETSDSGDSQQTQQGDGGQRRGRFGGGGGGQRGGFNNRGPRRGPGGNSGGGGQRGGQGRRPYGNNPRNDNGQEINGNVAPDLNMYQNENDSVDDNIGNRLAPGESSPFYTNDQNGQNK